MLRRKPTAITITSEDILAFEEARHRKQQQQQQQQRQQQEQGQREREQATQENARHAQSHGPQSEKQVDRRPGVEGELSSSSSSPPSSSSATSPSFAPKHRRGGGGGGGGGSGEIDPSDELKPWPGDRARIVRGREERIRGAGTSTSGATGTGSGGAGAGTSRRW